MNSDIDYRSIDIPEDESPEEYHYTARRAEILQLIERRGSPRLVNGAALARRYGCTRQNIYNDIDKLAEWADSHLGENETLEGETLFWRCIDGLLEEEDWRGAAAVFSDLADWRRQSDLEEMLERIEAIERQRERSQTNDYRLK